MFEQKVLKARNVLAQYKRRGTMSEMLGKKDTTPSQRWALIFGLKTFTGCQQDEEESELTKYDLRNTSFLPQFT
jgi:hypothetical protein